MFKLEKLLFAIEIIGFILFLLGIFTDIFELIIAGPLLSIVATKIHLEANKQQ